MIKLISLAGLIALAPFQVVYSLARPFAKLLGWIAALCVLTTMFFGLDSQAAVDVNKAAWMTALAMLGGTRIIDSFLAWLES